MDPDDFRRLARNPNFIPGIFDYCDRWCERCPFTGRCMSYAMERETDAAAGGPPTSSAEFWKRFESSIALAREMAAELANEQGITFSAEELAESAREQNERHRDAGSHPLAQAASAYAGMADEWFASGRDALRSKEEEILTQARLGVEQFRDEVASLTDAVEIVRWYQPQIYVKLMRALEGNRSLEAASDPAGDSDGSAKVALIGMDRSISGWLRLKEFFPERADGILTMLLHLDRLRRATESEFPKARSFIRPGFDDGSRP